jgi:hypothetical protein
MFGENCAPILPRHLHCLQMDWNEIPQDPHHLVVPSGMYKMISEPLICSTQTVHLSCVKINTISKWTESSIHLSLITKECHLVRPKQFLSLRYVWHKPCTYLALTPTLSPNWPTWDSTWPTSPWSSIGSSKMISKALVCSAQTVHLSCI